MKSETKRRLRNALETASEHLRSMREIGTQEDDYINFGEDDDKGFEEFLKACDKASKMIEKIAEKYYD